MKYISDNVLEISFKEIKEFLRNRGYYTLVLKESAKYPMYIEKYLEHEFVNRRIILCEKKENEKVIHCYLEPLVETKN